MKMRMRMRNSRYWELIPLRCVSRAMEFTRSCAMLEQQRRRRIVVVSVSSRCARPNTKNFRGNATRRRRRRCCPSTPAHSAQHRLTHYTHAFCVNAKFCIIESDDDVELFRFDLSVVLYFCASTAQKRTRRPVAANADRVHVWTWTEQTFWSRHAEAAAPERACVRVNMRVCRF